MPDQINPYAQFPLYTGGGGGSQFSGIDASKSGEAYLKQFPAEIQQGVRDYVHGLSMPTGNPRRENIVKMVAGKYGADIGMPADDASFKARSNLRSQLNLKSPSSVGGQWTNGTTALDHLAEVAEAARDLHNWGGWGIAPLAHIVNRLRSNTTHQSAAIASLEDAALKYGEEITKFYAGSSGGLEERERFLKAISGVNSPEELSAVIRREMALINPKMEQIRGDVEDALGTDEGVLGPTISRMMSRKQAIQDASRGRIQAALDQIEGRTGADQSGGAPTAAGAQNAPAGASVAPGGLPMAINPRTGDKLILQNGAWVPYGR